MKFKIRDSFVVHIESIVERKEGGRTIKDGRVQSHWAGEEIDITEKEARKHLHKLEPLDAEARKVLEVEYEKNRRIATNFSGNAEATLDELVAEKVAKALAAAGVGAKAPR